MGSTIRLSDLRRPLATAWGMGLAPPYARDLPDGEIAFFMPVFRDADVAAKALARLRAAYPASRVALVSDGDPEIPGPALAAAFGVEYRLGENLYGISHGGATIERVLDHFLAGPETWCLRLDSDARIDRRFRALPRRPGIWGRLGRRSGAIQGGAVLIHRDAARRLKASGLLRDPRVLTPRESWGRYVTPESLERKIAEGRIAYDKVLHWAAVEAGIPVRAHPEIFSVWKADAATSDRLANRHGRYAVVHPDKMTAAPPPPAFAAARAAAPAP